ncbi:MAG: NAD(P)/FAD-dependent oxidoreductase [Actinobacteria bacterium]|nr:MAG: NAD(P)/FAD-dependent oxidoreductase [Actinomycetota bacterium]
MHNHDVDEELDVVVVGAGFAGLYMLHKMREIGVSARAFEAGSGVGGTWYWNRYPGARCDVESIDYTYSFSEELQRDWRWSERYPAQPEILRYLNFVADKFDLRRDIKFETRVESAIFDDEANRWVVTTDQGDVVRAQFCVMATGCLSTPKRPGLDGAQVFQGATYHTGQWPHEGVDFTGSRVGIIGTGSSAIQSIPQIATQASHLTVFQRTPNFSIPAHNGPIDHEREQWSDSHFTEFRELARQSGFGSSNMLNPQMLFDATPEEREAEFERRWQIGGVAFLGSFIDLLFNEQANEIAADFVRAKIRATVHDPEVAAALTPTDHPFGSKRLCVDIDYFETYNRPNVTLVDLKKTPIVEFTRAGIRTTDNDHELDAIVFATGFDAMTGALLSIDIRGREGISLRDRWADGPRTYLGLMVAGFPNLLTITGPGSPSVLSNMVISIEQHVDWLAACFTHMRENGFDRIEPTADSEETWGQHVNEIANLTLFPRANSWYVGANIPGKPRVFMPYVGGVAVYRQRCDEIVASGYEGFELTPSEAVVSP